MPVYLVAGDLSPSVVQESVVHDYLQSAQSWHPVSDTMYLIESKKGSSDIRDDLREIMSDEDRFIVARITRNWAAKNLRCVDWLNDCHRKF